MSQQALSNRISNSRSWTLALGIGAALLAAVLLIVYLNRYRSSVDAQNAATPVLVAKNLIPRGTSGTLIAKQELFQVASLPKDELKIGAVGDPAFLNGRVAATDIFPGQQITTADLSVGTTEAVPTNITGVERAVAIPVDAARGLVGYTAQGDHVDIYMSLVGSGGNMLTLLAPNVEILRAPAAGQASTYVLKAPANLAQRIAFASDNSTLWFLLRPVVGAKKTPALTISMDTLLAQAKRNRTPVR
jgi:Flp pilus assembly protein CpaB